MVNPFADLIPAQAQATPQHSNPFADLIPAAKEAAVAPQQEDLGYFEQLKKDIVNGPEVAFVKATGRGLKDAGQGIKQLALMGGEKLGLAEQGAEAAYTKQVDAERAAYDASPEGQEYASKTGRLVGNTLPYLIGGPMGLLGRVATGAAIGGTQYVPEGGDRLTNTGIGAAANAVIPPAFKALTSANPYIKAATGAGILGGGTYLLSGGDPVKAGAGAAAGAALPFIPGAAASGATALFNKFTGKAAGPTNPLKTAAAMNMLQGVDEKVAQKTLRAARKLDPAFNITPAEASGSAIPAAAQGSLGTSKEGAQALVNFGKDRLVKEKQIIRNFLDDVSPDNASAAVDVRKAAQKVFTDKERALVSAAKPLYQSAGNNLLPEAEFNKLMENPRIAQSFKKVISDPDYANELAEGHLKGNKVVDLINKRIDAEITTAQKIKDVAKIETLLKAKTNLTKSPDDPAVQTVLLELKKDPVFESALKGIKPNSIRTLDLVKRDIDDLSSAALRAGEKNRGRLLKNTKDELVSTLDKFSPDYKAARSLYGEGAGPLENLRNSNLGRIADLEDTQLKQVTKILFDPAQTDIKVLADLRKQISAKNPDAWKRVVRNEMERRMDKAGDYEGSTFYNKVLRSDRDFKQFLEATRDIPGARRKLVHMKRTFKDLIEPVSAKTAAREAKLSFDVPARGSAIEAGVHYVKQLVSGKYDKASIELITSGKWDREFAKVARVKTPSKQREKMAELLGRISAVEATQPGEKK